MLRRRRFDEITSEAAVMAGMKARSVRGGTYGFASQGADLLLRVSSVAVLARLLVPEHFGLVAMVTAITAIADGFKDLGLSSATVQREVITHDQVSTLFWINLAVGGLLSMVVAALAAPMARFYDEPRLLPVALVVAPSFLISGAAVQHTALLRRAMRFRALAVIQIVSSGLSVVLAILLALWGFGYWALVAREVTRHVFGLIAAWVALPWLPGRPSRASGVGGMLRFGGDLSVFFAATFVSTSLGQVLMGRVFGAAALGLYRQGLQLVWAPVRQLRAPVTSVGDAALSRLQNDAERYRRYFGRLLLLMSMSTMPLIAFLWVFAAEVVLVLLGPSWTDATSVFRVLAIAVFLAPSVETASTVAVTTGRSRRLLWAGVARAAALALFYVIGIPWGPVGLVSAHIWAFYLTLPLWLYLCLAESPVGIRDFLTCLSRPLVATLIMATALLALRPALAELMAPVTLAIGAGAGALAYTASWWLLPGGRDTLREVARDISQALGRRTAPQALS